MRKNWIGTVVVVGVSMATGMFFSQTWEQVQGHPFGFPTGAPQVVVNQPTELPKWFVDFVSMPPQGGNPEIRVITVVDTEAKKIAVYHLNVTDGGLRWLSTRNIQPDLMFDQHNAREPLPSDVRREMQRLEGINR